MGMAFCQCGGVVVLVVAMVTCPMPAREEKISGAPFPNAMIVTPAIFWDSLDTAVSLLKLS